MFTNPGFTLGDQMYWIVDLFLKTLAAEACHRRVGSLSVAVWQRVKRLERRFSALYARWKAGTLAPARERKACGGGGGVAPPPPRPSPLKGEGELAAAGAVNTRPASLLPRGVRWMQAVLPLSAGTLGSMLGPLLFNHPEMQTFVAEAPQVGRILRPLCRLVGLKPPDYLALPKHKRVRKKAPSLLSEADEAELRRITALFPDIPAGRAAKRVWRRMFEGKPVDLTKLSAVALGLVLHAPRDGNCPPPEIGYGGRSFPRLPKDYVPPKDWE